MFFFQDFIDHVQLPRLVISNSTVQKFPPFRNLEMQSSRGPNFFLSCTFSSIDIINSTINYVLPNPVKCPEDLYRIFNMYSTVRTINSHVLGIKDINTKGTVNILNSTIHELRNCKMNFVEIKNSTIMSIYPSGLNLQSGPNIIRNTVIHHLHRNAITLKRNAVLSLVNVTIINCEFPCIDSESIVQIYNVSIGHELISSRKYLQRSESSMRLLTIDDIERFCEITNERRCPDLPTVVVSRDCQFYFIWKCDLSTMKEVR